MTIIHTNTTTETKQLATKAPEKDTIAGEDPRLE